jgi:hypothetical protein
MWRIFVPFTYLAIDHPEKRKFDFLLPLLIGLVASTPLLSTAFRSDALGSFNVIGGINSFLGILTGFFIAALAAVATFGKAEMDDPMPGEPPVQLEHRNRNESYFETLSRRRFLSFLFGYLALMTLLVYLAGGAYVVFDKYLAKAYFPNWRETIFIGFWLAYMFSFANILSNTLLGLFYLTDRIHRPNKRLKIGNDTPPP